jgi:hypothetical protein
LYHHSGCAGVHVALLLVERLGDFNTQIFLCD